MAIPFAPIIIAAQASTLLSQSYISSHPASGLVLVAPPHTTAAATGQNGADPLPEFTFEPHFPVLVLAADANAQETQERNRLVRDFAGRGVGRGGKGVTFETAADVSSDKARITVERWMDTCGF